MAIESESRDLHKLLMRSHDLDNAIINMLDPESCCTFYESERTTASFAASNVSLEYARGLRTLLIAGLPTAAIGLMRLQYDSLTRSMWLKYAASDADIGKLLAPLTTQTENAASRAPSTAKMLDAMVGKEPSAGIQMLNQFKDVHAGALNSYVHGGIHPMTRQREGYPITLLMDVARSSNALLTMTGMMLAIIKGDAKITGRMRGIQRDFADCLPVLLPHATA